MVAPSGDAINGVAWGLGVLAASTRSELVMLYPSRDGAGRNIYQRGVFLAATHGVIGTPSGRIVAPMGRRGLLFVGPKEIENQRVTVIMPPDEPLNIYRVICVASRGRGEVLACAARRSGFVAMPLIGDELGDTGKSLSSANADFVDVASLDAEGHPFAVAILTSDCSITLVRDLVADDSTVQTLHYGFEGERAYRVLCADGHVFLLTNRRLYAFVDLASRYLKEEAIEKQVTINSWNIEAVDASLGSDRSLLVVTPNCVLRIEVEFLINGKVPLEDHRAATEQRVNALGSDFAAMRIYKNSPWTQSANCELAVSSVTSS